MELQGAMARNLDARIHQKISHKQYEVKKLQHCLFKPPVQKYGKTAQAPTRHGRTETNTTNCWELVIFHTSSQPHSPYGTQFYCQPTSTTNRKMLEASRQLLDYPGAHPDATIRYYASDMILNIHFDASYLSESNASS